MRKFAHAYGKTERELSPAISDAEELQNERLKEFGFTVCVIGAGWLMFTHRGKETPVPAVRADIRKYLFDTFKKTVAA